jgi:hypothetical protein
MIATKRWRGTESFIAVFRCMDLTEGCVPVSKRETL